MEIARVGRAGHAMQIGQAREIESSGSRASASDVPRPSTSSKGMSGRHSLSTTAIRAKTVMSLGD
jgi:hypothetical protein